MIDKVIFDAATEAAGGLMEYGADDCCQWVRGLVLKSYGIDIMAGVAPYASQEEAAAVFNEHGGLVEAVIVLARAAGLEKASKPYPDDCVGLVLGQFGPTLAVRYNGWWVARADIGVAMLADKSVIMAWGLKCRQP